MQWFGHFYQSEYLSYICQIPHKTQSHEKNALPRSIQNNGNLDYSWRQYMPDLGR